MFVLAQSKENFRKERMSNFIIGQHFAFCLVRCLIFLFRCLSFSFRRGFVLFPYLVPVFNRVRDKKLVLFTRSKCEFKRSFSSRRDSRLAFPSVWTGKLRRETRLLPNSHSTSFPSQTSFPSETRFPSLM